MHEFGETACEKDLNHLVDPGDALVLFVRGEGDDATPVLEAAAKSIDDILGGARAPESTNSRSRIATKTARTKCNG